MSLRTHVRRILAGAELLLGTQLHVDSRAWGAVVQTWRGPCNVGKTAMYCPGSVTCGCGCTTRVWGNKHQLTSHLKKYLIVPQQHLNKPVTLGARPRDMLWDLLWNIMVKSVSQPRAKAQVLL